MADEIAPACPFPLDENDTVRLAHGGGGRAMQQLIETIFRAAFDNDWLRTAHDGAVFELNGRTALTTDSYVITPLEFPGGDIGSLAVHGTVNDLLMCGARPRYLSAGFILEEGLSTATLTRIVNSMAAAATEAGVYIVTGDIKVVERGKADGLYINTAGVGEIMTSQDIRPTAIQPGDAILLSGDIGRHGIAIMTAREDLGLEATITSDSAALIAPVLGLLEAGIRVHCLRDLTRGGLASGLVEIAETRGLELHVLENAIPVQAEVRAACELLGLDPFHVANEGRFIAFVDPRDAEQALVLLRQHEDSATATRIGEVTGDARARVTMTGTLGTCRVIDMLSGEQLPRIC